MMWDTFITCDSVRCHGKRGKAWGGHIVRLYGPTFCAQEQPNVSSTLFILKEKNCQTIPPGTLNVFYIQVIHTDNAKVSFVLIALCHPDGAAINFSKSPQNQNQTSLLL